MIFVGPFMPQDKGETTKIPGGHGKLLGLRLDGEIFVSGRSSDG
jgi:hypothetical protein|tara:strand:- start:53 stop:184 length:132 start_codon:yes stop_codon:yes gene_type:complete